MNKNKQHKERMVQVLYEMAKLIDSKITYNSIKEKLLKHPSFPYLFSITNTLSNFGIANKAVRIQPDQLVQLNTPFLVTTFSEDTILVKEVTNNHVSYFSVSEDWKKMSLPEFTKIWTNMAILIDTEKIVHEADYGKKRILERLEKLRIPLTLLFSIMVFTSVFLSINNVPISAYFICKILGLVVSIFLVNKEVNKNTKYSFCNVGTKLSCDDVLNSPAAKIFSWLSMTDLGFLYFSSTILALSLSTITDNAVATGMISFLALFSFTAIPYTLYSFFYQAMVIKKWCVLCLATIAILWMESMFGYFYLSESFLEISIGFKALGLALICLAFSIIFWMFFKGVLLRSIEYDFLRFSSSRITNNYEVFKIALQQQRKVEMDFQSIELTIGNVDAPNVIAVAINPFCPACAREYQSVLKLVDSHPNFAKIVIRFVGDFRQNRQINFFTSAMLVSHFLKSSSDYAILLQKWFELKDLKLFAKVFPIDLNIASEEIINHHYSWTASSNIVVTPALFLNGNVFPQNYTITQLIEILSMRTH